MFEMLLIILVILVVFGGGGYAWHRSDYPSAGYGGPSLILIGLVVLFCFLFFRGRPF